MQAPTFAFVSAILVSLLALSQSGVINDAPAQVAPYSIIDPIIKAILEAMKPKLANLKINDINQTIASPQLNASVLVSNILIKNADKFVIKSLKSNVVPLKLTNLTLTWSDITATARYNVDSSLGVKPTNPIRLFANGSAAAVLKDLFFTIGANIEMKNNAIQIKPKGLFGFDISMKSADVTLSSIMGSEVLGKSVGVFLSSAIPEVINVLKKPVFDAFQDDIIKVVNNVLKKNGTALAMDEYQEPQQISGIADSADAPDFSEFDSFFSQPLDLAVDLHDNEFNFQF